VPDFSGDVARRVVELLQVRDMSLNLTGCM
jgi:hypothetical protein